MLYRTWKVSCPILYYRCYRGFGGLVVLYFVIDIIEDIGGLIVLHFVIDVIEDLEGLLCYTLLSML